MDCVTVVDQGGQGAARPGPLARDGPRVEGRGSGSVCQARERPDGRTLPRRGRRPTHGLAHLCQRVEDNYQRLADILLSSDPDASKVQRLLALDLLPAPPIPRGYAIWSEGLLAEAFACFPTAAFPALWERLRTATANQDISRLSKALTMWGDRFATALAAWLASDTIRLQARAIHGLTLYAKGLNVLCDAEAPSLETHLHQTHYAELVRFTRDWDLGVAPAALLSGHPRHALAHQVGMLVVETADEARRIAMLRCIGRLCVPISPRPTWLAAIATLAAEADSRLLEREAIIALCHLDRAQACAYMRQHWLDGAPQRTMAAELLGLARTSAAFDLLLELMVDPRAETRRKAIASLASFASEDALRVLNAHQDPDPQTSDSCCAAAMSSGAVCTAHLPHPGAARARSMVSPLSCSLRMFQAKRSLRNGPCPPPCRQG